MNKKLLKQMVIGLSGIFSLVLISCSQGTPQISNQRYDALESRIISLEQQRFQVIADLKEENQSLKKFVRSELKAFRQAQLKYLSTLDEIRNDIQEITDIQDLTGQRVRKAQAELRRLKKSVGNQIIAIQELEGFFSTEVEKENSQSKLQQEFNEALVAYKKKYFQEASKKFLKFRAEHPESGLEDDALFYVAYIHVLKGDYEDASLNLFELITIHPQTNHLNEAKWWLAVSLEKTGDPNFALQLYKELSTLEENHPLRINAEIRIELLDFS